jgi:hypothetical protein
MQRRFDTCEHCQLLLVLRAGQFLISSAKNSGSPCRLLHRDYRHPKDDPSKPFICGHCERLVALSATSRPSIRVSRAVRRAAKTSGTAGPSSAPGRPITRTANHASSVATTFRCRSAGICTNLPRTTPIGLALTDSEDALSLVGGAPSAINVAVAGLSPFPATIDTPNLKKVADLRSVQPCAARGRSSEGGCSERRRPNRAVRKSRPMVPSERLRMLIAIAGSRNPSDDRVGAPAQKLASSRLEAIAQLHIAEWHLVAQMFDDVEKRPLP